MIAAEMRAEGIYVQGLQCDARFKYVKGLYKAGMDGNKVSGNSTQTCKFYRVRAQLYSGTNL